MSTEYWQKQAQKLAYDWAQDRSFDLAFNFLIESGLMGEVDKDEEKAKLEKKDRTHAIQECFGKFMALSFALGYLDGIKKQKAQQIIMSS